MKLCKDKFSDVYFLLNNSEEKALINYDTNIIYFEDLKILISTIKEKRYKFVKHNYFHYIFLTNTNFNTIEYDIVEYLI